MITQTNAQAGPESNSSDVLKDMSPNTNIHAPSFEDDEFDIPQVTLPAGAVLDAVKPGEPDQQPLHGYHHQYDQYYHQQQQQQWSDYGQMNYHPQYHQYPQQYPQYHHQTGQYQYQHDEMFLGNQMSQVSHRSPGSHSTPSPMSQDSQDHFIDNKRPSSEILQHALPVKKPKPSRRKKKRDPNEPQKPVSAYALFFRDRQASIKGRNPNMSFGEVSKMVASMWDSLDAESKAHYKKRTEMAKKEYLRQLAAYRATMVSKGGHEEMYGYMNYQPAPGFHHLQDNGVTQNIPPHPHPAHHPLQHHPQQHQHLGATTFVTNSQDYMNQHQQTASHNAAHGTDQTIHTGTHHPLPAPLSAGADHPLTSVQYPPAMDRNHNTMDTGVRSGDGGQCSRPGCSNTVNKAEDGTESTYCSSQCVVGQCRDAYQGWEQQQHCRTSTQHQENAVK